MPPNNSNSSRSQQLRRQQRVADELGIDPSQVAVRDTLDRGTEANLTSRGATAAERVRRQEFASEAEFVSQEDVTAEADRRNLSVSARVADNRREAVEQRAVSDVATDTEFVTAANLDADVGRRGVQAVSIPEEQRDDVEQRAVSEVATDTEFVTAANLDADVGKQGVRGVTIPEEQRDAVGNRAEADAAEGAEYVKPSDLEADVGKQGVKGVTIAEEQRDDVAARAEKAFAANSENITAADVDADVGQRGVSGIKIPESRQSRVASRVRGDILSDVGEFGRPSDVEVEVTESGIKTARLKEGAERAIAAREIDSEFDDVEVSEGDLRRTDDGFAPRDSVLKKAAASDEPGFVVPDSEDALKVQERFQEDDSDLRAKEVEKILKAAENNEPIKVSRYPIEPDIAPSASDFEVETGDDGRRVSLSDEFQRERAAFDIDSEFDEVDIDSGDLERDGDRFGLDTDARREVAAGDIDEEVEEIDVGIGDIERDGDGFGLDTDARRDIAVGNIDQQFEEVDVSESDIRQTGDGFTARDSVLQRAAAASATGVALPTEQDLRTQLQSDFAVSGEFVDSFVSGEGVPEDTRDVLEVALPRGADDERIDELLELRDAVVNEEFVDPSRFGAVDATTQPDPSDFTVRSSGVAEVRREDLRRYLKNNFDVGQSEINAFVSGADADLSGTGQGNASDADARQLRQAIFESDRGTANIDPDRFSGLDVEETNTQRQVQLRDEVAAERGALQFDRRFDEIDIGLGDVEQTPDGVDLTTDVERELAARQIDDQISAVEVGVGDVRRTDDGFAPTNALLRESGAAESAGLADPSTEDIDSFLESRGYDPSTEAVEEIASGDLPAGSDLAESIREGDAQRSRELIETIDDGEPVVADRFEGIDADIDPAPDDFVVRDSGPTGFNVGFDDSFERERAAFSFDTQFNEVDISRDDISQTDSGFGLDAGAQRAIAADRLEEQTPIEQIDPQNDLDQRPDGDGFALAGGARRQFAANQLEQETVLNDINPNTGLQSQDGGFGLSTSGQRRLAAERFERQTELDDVSARDVDLTDEGAVLESNTERRLAAELLDQRTDADVGVGDVDRVEDPNGEREYQLDSGVNL